MGLELKERRISGRSTNLLMNQIVKDYTGATKDLIEIIKEEFNGNNEIRFFISDRGNQRIEIIDLETNEKWQTLECVQPPKKSKEDNYDDISAAMISNLYQIMIQDE